MEPMVQTYPTLLPGLSPSRRRRRAKDEGPGREEIALRTSLDAAGNAVVEELPLTLEVLLDPREDVQVTQTSEHERNLGTLVDRLRRFLERDRERRWGVFHDLEVEWPGVRKVAPDVTMAENVENPKTKRVLDVAKEGCRVTAVVEVVSPGTTAHVTKDETKNPPLFAQVGVLWHVLVYPPGYRRKATRTLSAVTVPLKVSRLEAGEYVEQESDAEGRHLLRELGVVLSLDENEELVLEDAKTGERLLTSDEEEAARRLAEVRAETEAAARLEEAAARRKAEHRAAKEEEARQDAERQAREAAAARQDAERRAQDAEVRTLGRTLTKLLETRRLPLSDIERQRILDCRDPQELDRWIDRVFTVVTVDELWNE